MKKAYRTYQRVGIQTAEPVKIVVMLYDGLMKGLYQAMEDFRAKQNSAGSANVKRALDIINYLDNALDFEKGGEIATNLSRLYDYVRDVLGKANIYADPAGIQAAIAVLQPLYEGWQLIAAQTAEAPVQEALTGDSDAASEDPPRLSMVG